MAVHWSPRDSGYARRVNRVVNFTLLGLVVVVVAFKFRSMSPKMQNFVIALVIVVIVVFVATQIPACRGIGPDS